MMFITCGMMVSRDLRSISPIWLMSIPSISIAPVVGSMMRNSARVSDDLPAPVRPTTPIYEEENTPSN